MNRDFGHTSCNVSVIHIPIIYKFIITFLTWIQGVIFLCSHMYVNTFALCRDGEGVQISVVSMFSLSSNVTSADVNNSIQMSLSNCSRTYSHCTIKLQHQLSYYGTIQHHTLISNPFPLFLSSTLLHHFRDMIITQYTQITQSWEGFFIWPLQ